MKKALFALTWLIIGNCCLYGQKFKGQNTQIVDPDGNEFVIKGVNVNGPNWPWGRPTIPDADLITNAWKFNAIRVNCFPSLASTFPNNNTDLDGIVTTFTSRKIVTIIENHDFTGKYPTGTELDNLKAWWIDKANRFKNNTYVWFNIMNEPGNEETVPELWKTTHEAVVQAIRNTGAENIIVLDGHGYGQENGYTNPVASGILKYGPYFVQNYTNITFSLHMYSTWIYGQERLENYIDTLHAKNLSLQIGEYGSSNNYSKSVAADMFKACIPKKIGRIVWQWDGSDIHDLTANTSRGGAWEISPADGQKPTNLSFVGNLIWQDNHGTLDPNSTDLKVVSGPWLSNPSFENDVDEWFAFGGTGIETGSPNVSQGSKAFRVDAGGQGGCAQPIYLLPETAYVLTAWGKNSTTTSLASNIIVKYKLADGSETNHTLNFNETVYAYKRIEFQTPAQLSDASVVVYKGDAGITFYADNIQLVLKSEEVITALQETPTEESLLITPNPASSVLSIQLKNAPHRLTQIRLTDQWGRSCTPMVRSVYNNSLELEVSHLSPGLYMLSVTSKNSIQHRKVMIEK